MHSYNSCSLLLCMLSAGVPIKAAEHAFCLETLAFMTVAHRIICGLCKIRRHIPLYLTSTRPNSWTKPHQGCLHRCTLLHVAGLHLTCLPQLALFTHLLQQCASRSLTSCLLSTLDGQVEGMPDEVVFDHLHSTAFQYSPLGRTILGPASNIQKLTRQDLSDYIATHYTTPRMVRSCCDHEPWC